MVIERRGNSASDQSLKEAPMSFSLPLAGTAAREALGDLVHVAEVLHPANVGRLPDFREAIANGRRTIAGSDASHVYVICLRGDDERWLISVGRRGGWKKVWNFGTGRAA
jgi:hypothetical protein